MCVCVWTQTKYTRLINKVQQVIRHPRLTCVPVSQTGFLCYLTGKLKEVGWHCRGIKRQAGTGETGEGQEKNVQP